MTSRKPGKPIDDEVVILRAAEALPQIMKTLEGLTNEQVMQCLATLLAFITAKLAIHVESWEYLDDIADQFVEEYLAQVERASKSPPESFRIPIQ